MSQWYVHIEGETLGPLSTDSVKNMLAKSRLGFADYLWRPGLTKWVRVFDMDEFAAGLPSYPKSPIPEAQVPAETGHAKSNHARANHPRANHPRTERTRVEDALDPAPLTVEKADNVTQLPVPEAKLKPDARATAERRKWPKTRYAIRVPIEGKIDIQGHGSFHVTNISEGGLFIRSKDPIPVGTDIKFKLHCPDLGKTMDMTGVVIRQGIVVEGHVGFAISFTRLNPAHKRLIDDYVNKTFESEKVSGE
jgi:hypothetical protein